MAGDEHSLLNRCRHGEPDAWDELFDRHYAATARFIYQLAADLTPEDAEEICQEVFLAIIRNLENFSGKCQFQTWVFQIAANKTRDYRERRHAAKRGGGRTPISLNAEDPHTGLTIDPPANAPTPPELLISEEKAGLVHQAIEHLDAPCREVIELRYFGDLSYEEISDALALNAKTVSSRLSKCLDRLEAIVRRTFSRQGEPLFRLTNE